MLHIYCIIIAGDNLGGFDPQVHVTANNLKSISAVEHHGSLLDKINKKLYWVVHCILGQFLQLPNSESVFYPFGTLDYLQDQMGDGILLHNPVDGIVNTIFKLCRLNGVAFIAERHWGKIPCFRVVYR